MNSKQHEPQYGPLGHYCGFCGWQHAKLQCPNIAFTLRDEVTGQPTCYLRIDPQGFVPDYMKFEVMDTSPVYSYKDMLAKAEKYTSAGREEELASEFLQISRVERTNALEERNSRGERLIKCSFCAQKHVENQCPVIAYVDRETHIFYLRAKPKGNVPDFKVYAELDTPVAFTVEEMLRKLKEYSDNPELLPKLFLDRSCKEREKHQLHMKMREDAKKLLTAGTTSQVSTAQEEAAPKRKNKRQKRKSKSRAGNSNNDGTSTSALSPAGSWTASRASLPSISSLQDLNVPEDEFDNTHGMEEKVLFGAEQARQLLDFEFEDDIGFI